MDQDSSQGSFELPGYSIVGFYSDTSQIINFNCPYSDSSNGPSNSSIVMWVLLSVASLVVIIWLAIAIKKCSDHKKSRGAIQAYIRTIKNDSFPVMTYQKLRGSEEESCIICCQQFLPNDEVRVLACKHYYHKPCIDEWLQLHQFCCICKKKYSPQEIFNHVPFHEGNNLVNPIPDLLSAPQRNNFMSV